jgi:hypothetical protein
MAERNFKLDVTRMTGAGFYGLSMPSGLLTLIVARTATLGHLWACRYATATDNLFHVTYLRIFWQTLTGFTSAQEVAFAAFKLTGYSAAHTGGTAGVPLPLAPGYAASELTAQMAITAALTAGTHTIAQQLFRGSSAELAAGATIGKGYIDEQQPMIDDPHPVCVLGNAEGILVANEVLMGAAGVGRLVVDLRGYERAA